MTAEKTTSEFRVAGMDCPSCVTHIKDAVAKLPGVDEVEVLLAAERATVTFDPALVSPERIKTAITQAGYAVRDSESPDPAQPARRDLGEVLGWGVLGTVAVVVLLASLGEALGLFDRVVERLPWWIPALAVLAGGGRIFLDVLRDLAGGRITSHTLMTTGVIASAVVGQWTTAALIVFFMRFAEWVEEKTTARNRQALQELVEIQPATARLLREDAEVEVPVAEVRVGDLVLVRPGERIPVDGEVVEGQAPVNQAPITGESVPVEKGPGAGVFAATVVQAGFIKVRASRIAADTTFARIVRLVEEADAHKAPVQRLADRFTGYYLPLVLVIALATYLVTGHIINAVAVLVVTCACAIAIATPVVVLASVGYGAKQGLLIKGGTALEQLARVDTLVLDKTGTLTQGEPHLTDLLSLNGIPEAELLRAVMAVESRSEHPIARAIVSAAAERGVPVEAPEDFQPLPGRGLTGSFAGQHWAIGNRRLMDERGIAVSHAHSAQAEQLEAAGKTAFFVAAGGNLAGLVAVADAPRPEARAALQELKRLGIGRMLLLTGDNERVAAAVAQEFSLEYRANLMPEDKITAVRDLQAQGAVVMMIGDGINDAPALTQADVGVAMGAAGTDVAIEAADVALMRDDWNMVPEAIRLGRRAARTIRQNLGFTAFYNAVGITLAALGVLPPVWAAAAQGLPDVVIMLNSSRLMRGVPSAIRKRPLAKEEGMGCSPR